MPNPKAANTFRRAAPRATAAGPLEMKAKDAPVADETRSTLVDGLRRMTIACAHQPIALTPLAGGVSSDIYRAIVGGRVVCVKRALPRLKVAAEWQAPVERNRWEVEWMRVAAGIVPGSVPEILGEDRESGLFRDGLARRPTATRSGKRCWPTAPSTRRRPRVGDVLGRIHAATADRPDIAARFRDRRHLLRDPPRALSGRDRTRASGSRAAPRGARRGDADDPARAGAWRLQPQEHPDRPARPGDPRCRMRVVRRSGIRPRVRARTTCCSRARGDRRRAPAMSRRSRRCRTPISRASAWEPRTAVAARTAALLPGLLLARIDGKSPVEYLSRVAAKDEVRAFARSLLREPAAHPAQIAARWVGDERRRFPRVHARRVWDSRGRPTRRGRGHARERRSEAARSRRPARRAARARPIDLRDGGARFGGFDVSGAVANVNGPIAGALDRPRCLRPGAGGRGADRPGRHAEQGAPGRQRDGRGLARRRACSRRGERSAAVAIPRRRRAGHAAAAGDPDLRRRRARGPADRHAGPDGDAACAPRRLPRRSRWPPKSIAQRGR